MRIFVAKYRFELRPLNKNLKIDFNEVRFIGAGQKIYATVNWISALAKD